MRVLFAALLAASTFVVWTGDANAGCSGSGSRQSCTDKYGNSYTVSRFGNTVYMQGYNARTGNRWTQKSTTSGDTVYHHGTTNGRSWRAQENRYQRNRSLRGTDSRGRDFRYNCSKDGCN